MNKEYWRGNIENFMSKERYFDISGWEGCYQVSNYGNVKSLKRVIIRSNGVSQSIQERIMSNSVMKIGYVKVSLKRVGFKEYCYVHILMRRIFFNNNSRLMCVDHIDNNGSNNILTNLRIVSQKNNCLNYSKVMLKNGKKVSSKFKGVCWNSERSKWLSQCRIGGKMLRKRFISEIDAAKAYDNFIKENGKEEFAILNFPEKER